MAKSHVTISYDLSSDEAEEDVDQKSDTTADDEDGDSIKEDIIVLEDEMTAPVTTIREDIKLETDSDGDADGDDEDEMEDTNGDTSKDEKSGLANVMAKILAKQTVKDKPIILSKALSDNQLNLKRKQKEAQEALKEGRERKDSDDEEDPAKLKENILKKRQWEEMNKVRVDISQKDRERKLQRIATRGVVQLFNAVRQQQREIEDKIKEAGSSERRKDNVMKSLSKGAFLDLLKTTPNLSCEAVAKKSKKIKTEHSDGDESEEDAKPTWSILRDDFMMGAKMKDWDKEDDDDDDDGSGDDGGVDSSDDDRS